VKGAKSLSSSLAGPWGTQLQFGILLLKTNRDRRFRQMRWPQTDLFGY